MGSVKGFQFDYVQTAPWPIVRRPILIAEVGINHNGSMAIAKQLIDMAAEAGCDYVKFQKRTIDTVYTPEQLAMQRESPSPRQRPPPKKLGRPQQWRQQRQRPSASARSKR